MAEATTAPKGVWFYNFELALLAEGGRHVSLTATTADEDGPQLLCQVILDERADSVDQALALIKKGVIASV